jgi:rubrerythrin
MKISCQHFSYRTVGIIALFIVMLSGCAQDSYQRRADTIKDHVEDFYGHLKANRVSAAVHENEEIEAMADQMADTARKRAQLRGTTDAQREFALMKTARDTAAQNWIALGQYFSIKQQPDKARASYQRVVDTYTNPTERVYREQAARALKDLEIVSDSSPKSAP